ncbi:MAG: hypothetical protein Q8P22_05235 [Chloroflexota bacterium]|nr:hypothetical protein [Chloroflexota bacterium]
MSNDESITKQDSEEESNTSGERQPVSTLVRIARLLGELLAVAEVAVLFYMGALLVLGAYQLFFGFPDPDASQVGKVLKLLHEDWRGVLLIVLLVLYAELRRFVHRIRRLKVGNIVIEAEVEEPTNPSTE